MMPKSENPPLLRHRQRSLPDVYEQQHHHQYSSHPMEGVHSQDQNDRRSSFFASSQTIDYHDIMMDSSRPPSRPERHAWRLQYNNDLPGGGNYASLDPENSSNGVPSGNTGQIYGSGLGSGPVAPYHYHHNGNIHGPSSQSPSSSSIVSPPPPGPPSRATCSRQVANGGDNNGGGRALREPAGSRTHNHAPLEPEVVNRLNAMFSKFLQRICCDLHACDAKGDQIHQPLMAKKMQRLDASADFRPFKFRIQAFTNAFHQELVDGGFTEDILPLRKVKVYLWKHKLISRFNEDGKKQKSKGNHVWNIEARKVVEPSAMDGDMGTDGLSSPVPQSAPSFQWEFREFESRIAGPVMKFARVGVPYAYTPKIWDPQTPRPEGRFSSPWLPTWLEWKDGKELCGKPGPNDESCEITIIASYDSDGEMRTLKMTFPLTVSDPQKEGELMDSLHEDEDEQEEELSEEGTDSGTGDMDEDGLKPPTGPRRRYPDSRDSDSDSEEDIPGPRRNYRDNDMNTSRRRKVGRVCETREKEDNKRWKRSSTQK